MNKLNFILSVFYLFMFSSFVYSKNLNKLIDISYNCSNLTDELICSFDSNATLMFYKEQILQDKNMKEITFFIPLGVLSNNVSKVLSSLNKLDNNYNIKLERTSKPIEGIKIIFTYNFKDIHLDYGKLSGGAKLFFRFRKKNMLNLINQKINTFRWYAFNDIDLFNKTLFSYT